MKKTFANIFATAERDGAFTTVYLLYAAALTIHASSAFWLRSQGLVHDATLYLGLFYNVTALIMPLLDDCEVLGRMLYVILAAPLAACTTIAIWPPRADGAVLYMSKALISALYATSPLALYYLFLKIYGAPC